MDVEATCRAVANARVYFERIDLHPLAVALSFVQTVADKRVGFGACVLGVLRNNLLCFCCPTPISHMSGLN